MHRNAHFCPRGPENGTRAARSAPWMGFQKRNVRRSPEQGRRRGRAQPAPEARQRSSARAADGTARPCGQPQQPAHRAPARDRLQHRGRQVGDELARGHARCAWPESDWLHAVRGGHRRGSTEPTRCTGLLAAAGTCCARWWTPRWARWRPQAASRAWPPSSASRPPLISTTRKTERRGAAAPV